jgi:hypothetical protein
MHSLTKQAELLCSSFHHWTGESLLAISPETDAEQALMHASFAVASHDTQADPHFNYANLAALQLFKTTRSQFIGMPSRFSAEPMLRETRADLLAKVAKFGFVDDYAGIRMAADNTKFMIDKAIVWNVIDAKASNHGQAVVIYKWHWL